MIFFFSFWIHEWAQRKSDISSWKVKEKNYIHAQARSILHIFIFIFTRGQAVSQFESCTEMASLQNICIYLI